MINFGEVPAGAVLPIPFAAYAAATGASITLTGLAVTDIEVYKGTSMTQRASDAGFVLMDTDGIDLDGITGIHGFSIDTGDNTDASFYAVGSYFTVVVSAVTIDAQTINFIAATFRIRAAENTAGVPAVDAVRVAGTAQTARDIGASVLLSSGTGTGQLSLSSGLVTLAAVTHTGAVIPTVTTLTGHTAQTGDSFARLGAPAGASVSADIAAAKVDTAAVKVKTDFLPSATAGAAGGLFIAGSNAATSITTALTANLIGNITGNLSGSAGSVTGAVGSVTGLTPATVHADLDDIQARLPAALGANGNLKADVRDWLGDIVLATSTTGVPKVEVAIIGGQSVVATAPVTFPARILGTYYEGQAQAGSSTNITLNTGASAVTDFYKNDLIELISGPGTGQARYITGYNGTTKVATVSTAWATNPDGSTIFIIHANDAIVGATAPTAVQVADEVQTRTIAAVTLVNGLAANSVTAAALAADAGTEIGSAVWASATRLLTAGTNIALAKGTGVTGFTDLSAADVRTAVGLAAADLDTQLAALPTAVETADQVWDEILSGHAVVGSTGAALSAAGGSGDPWATALPGAYGAGTAGKIVGDNINATISSRLATAGYTAPDNTSIASILVDTAEIGAAGAGLTALSTLTAAGVRTAVGLAAANLDTQLDAVPTAAENASALLLFAYEGLTVTDTLCPMNAFRAIRNDWNTTTTPGSLTVFKGDGVTVAFTQVLSTDPAAVPITGAT